MTEPHATLRILVVEDDPDICEALVRGLELDGYEVAPAMTLEQARCSVNASEARFALVLLDVMLPDGNGLDLLAEMRAAGSPSRVVPVIVLTARGAEEDRVLGFEHGCDDYVVKPFSLKELRLRIQALLRRAGTGPEATSPGTARIGDARVDLEAYVVERHGETLPLSPKERDMLLLFLAEPRVVISRNRFLNEVWGYDRFPTTRTVDMHVLKLRQKIEGAGTSPPRHFVTVHGAGYRYDP